MSNTEPTDDELDEETEEKPGIKALRKAAESGAAATARNVLLEKKVAFLEAGIDAKSEIGSLLFESWDGQNVEELVAKATRLGALAGGPSTQQTQAEIDAAAQEAADNASRQELQDKLGGGGQPTGQHIQGAHPIDMALEKLQKDLRRGVDPDAARVDAMAFVLSKGHAEKDPRMVFDLAKHEAEAAEADRTATGGMKIH